MFADKSFTFSPQRLFSPARPFTSFSAAFNFSLHAFASASTLYLTVSASSNYLFNVLTFSLSILTLSLTIANSFFFTSTVSAALFYASTSGLTSLKIRLKVTMFTAQPHSFAAA
jgi:hypothetical protein